MPQPWFLKVNSISKELLGWSCLTAGCSEVSITPLDKVGSEVTGEELN